MRHSKETPIAATRPERMLALIATYEADGRPPIVKNLAVDMGLSQAVARQTALRLVADGELTLGTLGMGFVFRRPQHRARAA